MLKLLNIFSLLLISSNAFADGAVATPTSGGLMSFLPLILIFVIFYFLLIRPQQKKFKEHQAMLNKLKIGNEVSTVSGIIGRVRKIDDQEKLVSLEIAEGVVVSMLKGSVSQVLDVAKIVAKTNQDNKKSKKSKK